MKKHSLALLLAMSLILLLCAACGSANDETVQVSATMAPTDTPAPTPTPEAAPTESEEPETTPEVEEEPAEEAETAEQTESESQSESHGESQQSGGNSQQSGGNSQSDNDSQTAEEEEPDDSQEEEEDTRSAYEIASGMSGASVSDLIAAIGSPNSSTYSSSCLVIGAEDGELYYDGFSVGTLRYSDGREVIVGIYG